ncbi:hypothetical protein AB9K32_06375 [Allomuricauda sp. XS_ASV26]|uniref:hypothetical protein n=1 Tax=Allomuricauda sp. XS_ASV26 TaxID=3241292 RepID=UPI0035192492
MARKIHNHNGWKVIWTDSGKYGLSYDTNVLGEQINGELIEINEEVFNAASKPGISLKDLFEKYDLFNFKVIRRLGDVVHLKKKESTPNKYYGRGLIATDEDGHYFMEYQKAAHGGGSRKIEITEEVYRDIRLNDLGATEVLKKYNLYHLDVPENDVF